MTGFTVHKKKSSMYNLQIHTFYSLMFPSIRYGFSQTFTDCIQGKMLTEIKRADLSLSAWQFLLPSSSHWSSQKYLLTWLGGSCMQCPATINEIVSVNSGPFKISVIIIPAAFQITIKLIVLICNWMYFPSQDIKSIVANEMHLNSICDVFSYFEKLCKYWNCRF